jgi:hypothetical protein
MNTTKIIELFIDEEYEEAGIEAISLVSRPAHEETWMAFNRDECSCGTHKMEEEVEDPYSPYRVVEDNFCDMNPKLATLGEPMNQLIDEGWEIVRVEKITPQVVHKMNQQKFSDPNSPSFLDTENYRVRFKYVGPRDRKNRQFCAQMLSFNRVYRQEDIDELTDSVANEEFGFYNIFLWRGSFNCRHTWVRLIYKKEGKIINSGSSSRGLESTEAQSTSLQPDTRTEATINSPNPEKQWQPGMPRTGPNLFGDDSFATIGPRGGIKESKKAPKSDTPNPEPKGEGTAKGDASGKRGAKVTAEQEKTLQKKVDDFNEKDSNTKNGRATLGALKSVFQRGLGAYNTSHSPSVQSSEQWAYARVNAFLYLLKNGRPENPKYDTDFDLLPKDHPKAQKMSEEVVDEEFIDSITDYPEGVKDAAKRAVDWAEENGWGSCGTAVGKTRASQLAKGEAISIDTLKRMYSYLSRHKVDLETSKSYEDGCGKLMYDSWGGEAGLTYSERKLKQLENMKMVFSVVDEDKRIIVGAAMVPNKMIHRYDDLGNLYYVFFSKESIKKMADKFLKEKRTDETSIEHNGLKLGSEKVYITESWVSEDPVYDKSSKYGFELPAGTWFVSMKVADEKVWKLIKEKALTGYSVEGLFAEKSVFSKEDKQINQIKQLLKSIKDYDK